MVAIVLLGQCFNHISGCRKNCVLFSWQSLRSARGSSSRGWLQFFMYELVIMWRNRWRTEVHVLYLTAWWVSRPRGVGEISDVLRTAQQHRVVTLVYTHMTPSFVHVDIRKSNVYRLNTGDPKNKYMRINVLWNVCLLFTYISSLDFSH
jgi:hypothetical protein